MWSHFILQDIWCEETYSDVLASPVALLPPVDGSGPVDLKHSGQRSDEKVADM